METISNETFNCEEYVKGIVKGNNFLVHFNDFNFRIKQFLLIILSS